MTGWKSWNRWIGDGQMVTVTLTVTVTVPRVYQYFIIVPAVLLAALVPVLVPVLVPASLPGTNFE
jgi:hypothetical protein